MVMIGRKEFVKTHQFSTIDSIQDSFGKFKFLSLSIRSFSLFSQSSFSSLFSLLLLLLLLLLLFFFETYAGVEPRLFQVDGYGVIQKALARSVLVAKALLPVG